MPEQQETLEQIKNTIRIARDSVWVITDEIQKATEKGSLTDYSKDNIRRNVAHLKLVVANPEISGSGENIDDLLDAIEAGEAELAK